MRLIRTFSNEKAEVKIYKDDGEFICKLSGNPAADYFTDDWQDAEGTAKHMLAEQEKKLWKAH